MRNILKKSMVIIIMLLAWSGTRAEVRDTVTFAVLGNSISTYYDYIPDGYKIFYNQDREKKYGIQVGDTWWMQLSRMSGITFLANASWSGSRVSCDLLESDAPFVSNARIEAIGRAGNPDLIFIMGGTNDWNQAKLPLGNFSTENFTDSITFRGAYTMLLHKLTRRYPDARIICLSITPRSASVSQQNAQGYSQADANASIKKIAAQFGAYYVDMTTVPFSSDWNGNTLDKLHPTAKGAGLMATTIYNALLSQNIITKDLKQKGEVEQAEALLDISFDKSGIVNRGTYDTKVGAHGAATTLYDADNDTYYGCSKATASDYFYALYDEDTPLAQAFNENVTWEILVRLDGLADQDNKISNTCFFSSEQNGGWSFYNSELASNFSYTHQSGVKSTMKNLTSDSILVSGKFYHLVVTMDRVSHVMRYFVNGKLVCTGTRAGTDMSLPQCGSVKGKRNMWICLGGDAAAGTYSGGAEHSSACSFVFARIYNGALTQKAAFALYTNDVKRFTEPQQTMQADLIMDCQFTPDGAVNYAPSFRDRPIKMVGRVPLNYNASINLYQSQFSGSKTQFFGYFMGDNPTVMSQLSDEYSVEIFCQNSTALPKASTRPLCFVNGYGFGVHMNSQGNICYTTTTQGNKADGTFAKTQWSWIGSGSLTTNYTHYLIVYDRKHYTSRFYVNGELKASRWLTFKECPLYEWAPSCWVAIGGDATGVYASASTLGNYPFMGNIAMVRIWSKALTEEDAQSLHSILMVQEQHVTIGNNGYVAVCLPYIYEVPEGCTACIATEIVSPNVKLTVKAKGGEYVPYGTPVLLKGEAGTKLTLKAANKKDLDDKYLHLTWDDNLLVGTMTARQMEVGDGYYLRGSNPSMYRVTSGTILPAFSCYLPSAERRTFFSLDYHETDDAIQAPLTQTSTQQAYNLQGQPTSHNARGIKIVDGKKVMN